MFDQGLYDAKIDLQEKSTWYVTTPTARTTGLPFYLLEWGNFIAGKEYYTVRNNNRFLLFYTISGRGELLYEGRHYDLEEGSIAIIWCGVRHEYKTSSPNGWEFKWIHYNGTIAHEYFRIISDKSPAIFHLKNNGRCVELIEILTATTNLNGFTQNLMIAMFFTELMTLLSCSFQETTTGVPHEIIEKIDLAVQYMETNLQLKLSVEEIASAVFLSKFYFMRMFKKVIGMSPYQYLTSLRVNKVKEHLILTQFNLSEIAEQTGFCDSKNMIMNFKKITGQTPEQFRKSNLVHEMQEITDKHKAHETMFDFEANSKC